MALQQTRIGLAHFIDGKTGCGGDVTRLGRSTRRDHHLIDRLPELEILTHRDGLSGSAHARTAGNEALKVPCVGSRDFAAIPLAVFGGTMNDSDSGRGVRGDRSSARGVAPEVLAHYERYAEETRLELGSSRLEFERTKDILERVLPPAPASIVDVGGAAGAYSFWLAERGYEVHLVDITPRLIEEARKRSATATAPLAS